MSDKTIPLRNVICTLNPEDTVMVDWAFKGTIGGKTGKVISVRRAICESGFMVKLDLYGIELDSNWLIKQ